MPRNVAIIFDADFSSQLEKLAFHTPVWLVDTPANTKAAEDAWQRAIEWPHIRVTLFRAHGASPSRDDWRELAEQIAFEQKQIEGIEIVGTALTDAARSALGEAGYSRFEQTPSGFRARR